MGERRGYGLLSSTGLCSGWAATCSIIALIK